MPGLGTLCKFVYFRLIEPCRVFPGSDEYWKQRYAKGGTSGEGSYNSLARFKADIINAQVKQNSIDSVIEFGCGDGNQLALAQYPNYIGVDISPGAIDLCKKRFDADDSKSFVVLTEYAGEQAEMSLSLDVVYHLIEDSVFERYMEVLFAAAIRFVVIYSSNTDVQQKEQGKHVRHRRFTTWIEKHKSGWELLEYIPNKYPFRGNDNTGSFADFFIYRALGPENANIEQE